MFTKKPDAAKPALPPSRLQVAQPASPGSGNDAATVIGAGLTITGNVESKGEVQVEGEMQGDVHAIAPDVKMALSGRLPRYEKPS